MFPFDIFVGKSVLFLKKGATVDRFGWIVTGPLTQMAVARSQSLGVGTADGGDTSNPTSVSPPLRRYHRRSHEASPYQPLHLHAHCHGLLLLFLSVKAVGPSQMPSRLLFRRALLSRRPCRSRRRRPREKPASGRLQGLRRRACLPLRGPQRRAPGPPHQARFLPQLALR